MMRKEHRHTVICANCDCSFQGIIRTNQRFCSAACVSASRRIEGAKWRDPVQVKAYMRAYVQRNLAKHNERSQEWAAKNLEKRRAIAANYAHRARELGAGGIKLRTRLKGHKYAVTADRLRDIYARANHHCVYCAKKVRKLTIDHYDPVSKGGRHTPGNLVPACFPCNASKGAKQPEDWIERKFGPIGFARTLAFLNHRRPIAWSLYRADATVSMKSLKGIEVELA